MPTNPMRETEAEVTQRTVRKATWKKCKEALSMWRWVEYLCMKKS